MTEMSFNDIWKVLQSKFIFKDKIQGYSTKQQLEQLKLENNN